MDLFLLLSYSPRNLEWNDKLSLSFARLGLIRGICACLSLKMIQNHRISANVGLANEGNYRSMLVIFW
jgi:hypothetical protein